MNPHDIPVAGPVCLSFWNLVEWLNPAVYFTGLSAALKPKADPARHPDAFYQGLRLCGIDGSTFSVANTPQIKKRMADFALEGPDRRGGGERQRRGEDQVRAQRGSKQGCAR
jgi:hypothetical protein